MIRNKKGQYAPQQPYMSVHPVLVIGIVIFVAPFLGKAFQWNIPGWFSGLGIFTILVGAVLSMLNADKGEQQW